MLSRTVLKMGEVGVSREKETKVVSKRALKPLRVAFPTRIGSK